MPSLTALFERTALNRAGRALVASSTNGRISDDDFAVISEWRSSHSFPLNTMKLWLVGKSKQVDRNALVAQRLKRLSSISHKLERYPSMRLTQMQDVAGCRSIVNTVNAVYALRKLYQRSDLKHRLVGVDDYLAQPKPSGYRGMHLVYEYFSDKQTTYNGLKVEIQLRSTLQHAWATAVETVGLFTQQALKSSRGSEEWLRFFALMGSALASREGHPPVPGTPPNRTELKEELRELAYTLDVNRQLQIFAAALRAPEKVSVKGARFFLLELDPLAFRIRVTGYKANERSKAEEDYLVAERKALSGGDRSNSVLVSVETFSALKRAYPNYFLDTHRFISSVEKAIIPVSPRDNPAQRLLFPDVNFRFRPAKRWMFTEDALF